MLPKRRLNQAEKGSGKGWVKGLMKGQRKGYPKASITLLLFLSIYLYISYINLKIYPSCNRKEQ